MFDQHWLNIDQKVWRGVEDHVLWLADPTNQQELKISSELEKALHQQDPQSDRDLIFLLALLSGLIAIRILGYENAAKECQLHTCRPIKELVKSTFLRQQLQMFSKAPTLRPLETIRIDNPQAGRTWQSDLQDFLEGTAPTLDPTVRHPQNPDVQRALSLLKN